MTDPEQRGDGQDDGEVDRCDKCDNVAQWTWHDGRWTGGLYCHDHIRDKLEKDRKFPDYKDAITTEENVTQLRDDTAIIPAGARPLDRTYPVIRTKGALDQLLDDEPESIADGSHKQPGDRDDGDVDHTDGFGFDYIRCSECDMLVAADADRCGICDSEVTKLAE